MKISFCVPIFNKEAFLADSIESLLNQTHQDIEIILWDDKSSDGCQYICKHYVTEYPTKVKYYRNDFRMGVAFARNSAWDKATGDIICVHDADDLSMANRAEIINKYFIENKDTDIVYGNTLIIDSFNRSRGVVEAEDFSVNVLKRENFIQHPSVAYRRDIGVKYREGLKYIDDWYFYLDCVLAHKKFGCIRQVLACYRPLEDGLTLAKGYNSKKKESLKDDLREEFKDLDDDLSDMLLDKNGIQFDRVKEIFKEVKRGSRVLDIGCNGGAVIEYLRDNKDCKVKGVEIARNLVDICKKKGLDVVKANALTYNDDEKYDYIILADILEHYNRKDVYHILKNAESMLRDGGSILITVPHGYGIFGSHVYKDHIETYSKKDFEIMLRNRVVNGNFIYTEGYSIPTWEIICVS